MVDTRQRLSLTSRLFAWSLVIDPLLFFVFADRSRFGVTIALGRALQAVVLILLALKLPLLLARDTEPDTRVVLPPGFLWRNYAIYVALAVVAGAVGLASGAYSVPTVLEFNPGESQLAQEVNAVDVRPLVEYVIVAFYFVYFVILTPIILNTRAHLDYFFRAFRLMLLWCLALGFADLVAVKFFAFEQLPRHLSDGVMVGPRFHGLAGEPRNAAAYLLLGLAVMHARAYFTGTRISRRLVVTIIVAGVLTQSASGLVGMACFMALYALETLSTFHARAYFRFAALLIVAIAATYAASLVSARVGGYFAASRSLRAALEARQELPGMLQAQKSEIYPLYDMARNVSDGRWWPVLAGSGLGSASAVNNRLAVTGIEGLSNPNSQAVRTLYESGLIGTFFFVAAFVAPVRRWTTNLSPQRQRAFVVMTLLVLGGVLGVRGTAAYIYLGILAAMFAAMPATEGREPA